MAIGEGAQYTTNATKKRNFNGANCGDSSSAKHGTEFRNRQSSRSRDEDIPLITSRESNVGKNIVGSLISTNDDDLSGHISRPSGKSLDKRQFVSRTSSQALNTTGPSVSHKNL